MCKNTRSIVTNNRLILKNQFLKNSTFMLVKISTSFKQRVFNKIAVTKKEKTVFTWFTPQLQVAAMVVILLVNASAIVYTFSTEKQTSEVDAFAQEYNFNSENTFTIH